MILQTQERTQFVWYVIDILDHKLRDNSESLVNTVVKNNIKVSCSCDTNQMPNIQKCRNNIFLVGKKDIKTHSHNLGEILEKADIAIINWWYLNQTFKKPIINQILLVLNSLAMGMAFSLLKA